MADSNGSTPVTMTNVPSTVPSFPRTERPDAPAYLSRYLERQARGPATTDQGDSSQPLYLRRFRERRDAAADPWESPVPLWQGENLGVTRGWAEVTRTKEIVPERREQAADVVTDVYLVRHGETQGYSSESGLTPLGSWQSHRRGQEIARRVLNGQHVVLGSAETNRARQTAEHLRRGLLDPATPSVPASIRLDISAACVSITRSSRVPSFWKFMCLIFVVSMPLARKSCLIRLNLVRWIP